MPLNAFAIFTSAIFIIFYVLGYCTEMKTFFKHSGTCCFMIRETLVEPFMHIKDLDVFINS